MIKVLFTAVMLMFVFAGCGEKGAAGEAGSSCTVKDNEDGTVTITCEDGTEVTIAGGKGEKGESGTDGSKALVKTATEEPGENCTAGGVKIESGIDDGTGNFEGDTVVTYVCNGEKGIAGEQGEQGENGENTLVKTALEPEGENCINGGVKIETGTDDGTGEFVEGTVKTTYICNSYLICPGDYTIEDMELIAKCNEITGSLSITGSDLEKISFFRLVKIWGNFQISGNTLLGVLEMENLESIGGNFSATGNSSFIQKKCHEWPGESIEDFIELINDREGIAGTVTNQNNYDKVCFANIHDGLFWSDKSATGMKWQAAVDYCSSIGGRLPNIQELRSLVQDCPALEYPKPASFTGGWCALEDPGHLTGADLANCSNACEWDTQNPGKYSVFGDYDWMWSSSAFNPAAVEGHACIIVFGEGAGFTEKDNTSGNDGPKVRCVR